MAKAAAYDTEKIKVKEKELSEMTMSNKLLTYPPLPLRRSLVFIVPMVVVVELAAKSVEYG